MTGGLRDVFSLKKMTHLFFNTHLWFKLASNGLTNNLKLL
jgi:hypothetical protein